MQLPINFISTLTQDNHGAVFTKPWVVELIVDLAGYTCDRDLATMHAVEPAIGDGAFVVEMARRLIISARNHKRPIMDCRSSIAGFDLDPASVELSRQAVLNALIELGVPINEATELAREWIHQGNYLFEAPGLPQANFVIGNPPYIRLEDIGDEIVGAYRSMYQTMKGRADIYVAFYEAALRQLRPDGVCAYICADRWMLNQYGTALRSYVTKSFGVETVIEMHTANAFESDVSAYPAVTIIRRAVQGSVVVARADENAEQAGVEHLIAVLETTRAEHSNGHEKNGIEATRVDSWFTGDSPWPCTSPERLHTLRYLEEHLSHWNRQSQRPKSALGSQLVTMASLSPKTQIWSNLRDCFPSPWFMTQHRES